MRDNRKVRKSRRRAGGRHAFPSRAGLSATL